MKPDTGVADRGNTRHRQNKLTNQGLLRISMLFSMVLALISQCPALAGIGDLEGTWTTRTDQRLSLKKLPATVNKSNHGSCTIAATTGSGGKFTLTETTFGVKRKYTGTLVRTGDQLALKFAPGQFEANVKTWFRKVAAKKSWKIRSVKVVCDSCATPSFNCSARPFLATSTVKGKIKAVINGKPAVKTFVYVHATQFTPIPKPPDKVANPYPADGDVSVDLNAQPGWSATAGATSYDVCFGTGNPPPFVRNQTTRIHQPGALSYHTTYYWRISSRNATGVTAGDVWSFTTRGPADPTLTVNFTGTGKGSVTDGAAFTCTSSSSRSYPSGTVVTLTATASTGSVFNSWSGEYTSTSRYRCTVTLDRSKSVTVDFGPIPPATVTIFATYDNLLYKNSLSTGPANTVYNNSDLAVGSTWQWWPAGSGYWTYDWYGSAIFFPIGQVAGKTINSAVLKLYPRNVVNDPSILYEIRAYSSEWYPDDLTWNNAVGMTTKADGARQVYPPVTTALPLEFDVTYIVRQWAGDTWPNLGFRLWMYNNDLGNPYVYPGSFRTLHVCSIELYDGDPNRRPQLVIEYQ